MDFKTALWSDVGIRKNTNQDSALIETADTDCGKVCLAVVCDGMGGLALGEVASAVLISAFSEWFENRLPYLLKDGFKAGTLQNEWEELVCAENRRIAEHGDLKNVRLGTTLVALLIVNGYYYIMNVGDSRVYKIRDRIIQMTRDQTYIQREMDEGRMTYEEAMVHPQRNVLLQCVGASDVILPEFLSGPCETETMYLICSDGFRHVISTEELFLHLKPELLHSEEEMQQAIRKLTDLNKERMEVDNITSVLVRTCREG